MDFANSITYLLSNKYGETQPMEDLEWVPNLPGQLQKFSRLIIQTIPCGGNAF